MRKKISPIRLSDLPGARRKKPPVRAYNRQLRSAIEAEDQLVQTLRNDRETRIEVARSFGLQPDALEVWTDFYRTGEFTEQDPRKLPRWKDLTEFMKFHVAFMATESLDGYAFTSKIHPDLLGNWMGEDRFLERVVKRLKDGLAKQDIPRIEFAFVIEMRTRGGKSRTAPHLHGFVIPPTPLDITRFKIAFEGALHRARGALPQKGKKAWHQHPAYDRDKGDGRGFGRWTNYILKNVRRYDQRVRGRRVYMSQSITQAAQEFWKLVREDPVE